MEQRRGEDFYGEQRPRRCPNIQEIIQALQGILHVLFLKFPSFFNMLEEAVNIQADKSTVWELLKLDLTYLYLYGEVFQYV